MIAHHPHVIQGAEEYKGALIAYSLGNLVFDSPSGPGRRVSKEGTIEDVLKLMSF